MLVCSTTVEKKTPTCAVKLYRHVGSVNCYHNQTGLSSVIELFLIPGVSLISVTTVIVVSGMVHGVAVVIVIRWLQNWLIYTVSGYLLRGFNPHLLWEDKMRRQDNSNSNASRYLLNHAPLPPREICFTRIDWFCCDFCLEYSTFRHYLDSYLQRKLITCKNERPVISGCHIQEQNPFIIICIWTCVDIISMLPSYHLSNFQIRGI